MELLILWLEELTLWAIKNSFRFKLSKLQKIIPQDFSAT
jgi:hypothetical protein